MFVLDVQALLQLMGCITNTRTYRKEPLSVEHRHLLYEAFTFGPSSAGNQARELIVIKDLVIRKKLIATTLSPYMKKEKSNQEWLEHVPFLAITVIEMRRAIAKVGNVGLEIAERESESSLQNMRIIAETLDIGTAVVREFDEEALQEQLSLPWYVSPVAMIAAGYKQEHVKVSDFPRLAVDQIVHKDRWL